MVLNDLFQPDGKQYNDLFGLSQSETNNLPCLIKQQALYMPQSILKVLFASGIYHISLIECNRYVLSIYA